MKVLEPGRPQKGWSTEVRCTGNGNGGGGCNALLLVEQNDLYLTYRSHYDGSGDNFVTFTCDCCGVETDLDDFPQFLYDKVYKSKHQKEAVDDIS